MCHCVLCVLNTFVLLCTGICRVDKEEGATERFKVTLKIAREKEERSKVAIEIPGERETQFS